MELSRTVIALFVFGIVYCYGEQPCFPKCLCNKTAIICDKANINTSTLTILGNFIHSTTELIRIRNSHITELPRNLFRSDTNCQQMLNMKTLDLSSNYIQTIHGQTFHCMGNLETLNLSHNEWMLNTIHVGYFSQLPKLRVLDLTNAFREKINGSIHVNRLMMVFQVNNQYYNMTKLEELYMGRNEFSVFPDDAAQSLCGFTSLRILDLSYDYLSEPHLWGSCTVKIESINLSNNIISSLPDSFLSHINSFPKLESLNISNNRFSCGNKLIPFYKWLNKTHVVDNKENILCHTSCGSDTTLVNRPILSLKLEDFDCADPSSAASRLRGTYIVMGLIFGLLGVVFVVVLYLNRGKIKTFAQRCPRSLSAPFRISYLSPTSHQGYSTVNETI